ncbi:MAG: hypothetical protein IBX72_10745 [Nitrospirae bacterium]|nr:hypothetical protein [Nitrospirota bacterium]
MKSKEIFKNLLYTKKFIIKVTCMSFPLVGNYSESPLEKGVRGLFKERFWTSQNDRDREFSDLCLTRVEVLTW